jgi:hypothetical protein
MDGISTRAERERWLHWTVLDYAWLAKPHQPPYGDRAVELRQAGQVIGACGFVPCLDAFGQMPSLAQGAAPVPSLTSTEFGLFWAIAPRTEAVRSSPRRSPPAGCPAGSVPGRRCHPPMGGVDIGMVPRYTPIATHPRWGGVVGDCGNGCEEEGDPQPAGLD